jgi:hypothetical protein
MCIEYNDKLHKGLLERFAENKKPVIAYKAYWYVDFKDGPAVLPVFGDRRCGMLLFDKQPALRWDFANEQKVEFDGWQDSPRQTTELSEDERRMTGFDDKGMIEGLYSFLYPRDAILWAWHWAGMRGQKIGVVPVKVYKEDFVTLGIGGYDIREYDTCESGPALVSKRVKVTLSAIRKPLWVFDKSLKNLGKKPLLSALAAGRKVREKPRSMSALNWSREMRTVAA